MENFIKLSEALGWPVATTLIALVALAIVLRVTSAKGEFTFGIKDWFNIGSKTGDTSTLSTPVLEPPEARELIGDNETTAETVAEVRDENTTTKSSFWTEADPSTLATEFSQFKDSDAYQSDPEFWESIYVDRRRELSVGDELRDLSQLSEQNPTWVWPLIFLIRRHVRLRDSVSSEAALKAALARDNTTRRRWVMREGVALYYRLFGYDKAISFCREEVNKGASDTEISTMFTHLAELSEVEEDTFSSALLREISTSFDRSQKSNLFSLAYRYGAHQTYSVVAFERYKRLGTSDKNWQSSPNNMGTALKGLSESAQNEFFEKALELGSGVAAANLARAMVDDGYIRRAELVLQ